MRGSVPSAGKTDLDSHLEARWFLLRVRHRSEKQVAAALRRKGFEVFLPTICRRRQWSDRIKEVEFPLFPCYLFCRFSPKDQLFVVSTRNVLSGVGADPPPIPVQDCEVAALKRVLASGLDVEPGPYPEAGQTVRIRREPLCDVKGVIVPEGSAYRLMVGVEATQLGASVKIPRELIDAE